MMQRTYSMRKARTPTASDLANQPPPPSSAKKSFFGTGSIASILRKQAAGSFGPELSRKLAQLIKIEKSLERSMEVVANERRLVAKQLSIWGEENDDDVSDVTDKLGVLLYELGELEDQFIDKYDLYRITLKSIRDIESSVQPTRNRKQKITDEIAHLKYKDPQSPKIPVLEQELVRAEAQSLVAEAQLSNITREKLKAAYVYQLDSLREFAEKEALIAGYGKALLELLDDAPVTPGETRAAYDGYETSRQIVMDCENGLATWTLGNSYVKEPTMSLHHDEVYTQPEEEPAEEDEEQIAPAEEEPTTAEAEEPATEEHTADGTEQPAK